MKAGLYGKWADIEIYNDTLSEKGVSVVGLDLISRDHFGHEEFIERATFYPEDLEKLKIAISMVLSECYTLREEYPSTLPTENLATLTYTEPQDHGEFKRARDKFREELKDLMNLEIWIDFPRDDNGVCHELLEFSGVYKEFVPFLAWDSEEEEIVMIHSIDILTNKKFTKFKGITKP